MTFGERAGAKLRALVAAPVRGVRSLARMVFRRNPLRMFGMPRSKFDYLSEVGDGTGSSTVMAPLMWIARTFPEAPLAIWRTDRAGQEIRALDHPLLRLMRRPNPHYQGSVLWMATLIDWFVDGNAYWLKVRDGAGKVRELWWAPHWTMEPKGTETEFVTHYEYRPGGQEKHLIPVEDVVHFRFGLDGDDPRKGRAPLKSVLREVFTDDEAANFTASLLRNMGVPGLMVSPDGDKPPSDEDVKATKAYLREQFSGDKRGEALVMSGPTKVQQFGFSPEQLLLKELRRIPEERVSAVIGVPAIVAGLGAGLDRCLPGEARVWTANGTKPITEIEPGDLVWSEVGGRLELRAVTRWARATPRPVYEIRTKNRVIRASGNHPVLVRVPGSTAGGSNDARRVSYGYKRADEIQRGDFVVQAKALPDLGGTKTPDGVEASCDLMRWLGAMIGDGSVTGSSIRMAMPPEDRCHAAYTEMAEALFTRQARQSGGGAAIQESLPRAPISIGVRERDFGFRSALGARRLVTLGVTGTAKTKRVPGWIYGLTRELRLAFLAGVVDTDGSIDSRGVLTICQANEALVHDLRDLLTSCGVQASNVARREISASALPNPGRQEKYEAWSFVASSARSVAQIPFLDPLYRERVEANPERHDASGGDAHKAGLDAESLGFFLVSRVTVHPPEPLFDIEVAGGGHNFIADGVVVSNSTFSNFSEAREAAYEQTIIPTQGTLAEDIWFQLLPEFEPMEEIWLVRIGFDLSRVRVLQPDQDKLAARVDLGVRSGWIMRWDARRALGLPVEDARDRVFLVPLNVAEVPADGSPHRTFTPPPGADRRTGAEDRRAAEVMEQVEMAVSRKLAMSRNGSEGGS